nr:TIM barrel protein [Caldilineaceae bacterium]
MPLHFAPNLSMLYTEVPFLDRFGQAAAAGFDAVEFLFPYEFGAKAIRQQLDGHSLRAVLFNINPGDLQKGERGSLSHPHRRNLFRSSLQEALDYASQLSVPRLHVMAGNRLPDLDPAAQFDCALENLLWATPLAAACGVTLLLEPLNAIDMPGYFISSTREAMKLVTAANLPNVKL